MPDRGLMGLFGMLPQEAETMPRGLFAPDPDLEWLVDQVRKARLAEELRAAGFNPDVTPGQALREFAVTAPVELAMAAFPAARFFPKTTGAAAGLLSYFGLTGEAGSSDEGVKETQRRLKELGYYTGPIDGKMGPQTQAAMQRYEQDRVQREQAEAERLKAQAEAERIQFEREQAQRQAEQRAAGEQRMREIEESVSPFQRILRDYGPLVGYIPGIIGGFMTRRGMVGSANRASQAAAERANKLVSGEGDLQARMGGVNQFWQEGGARAIPFAPSPRARFGMRSNPDAPSATTLYPQPPARAQWGGARDVGVLAGAGAEAWVGHKMAEDAQEEVRAAYEAVQQDPSEANIQRLHAALDRAAMWETVGNLGRGMMLGYVGAAPKFRYQTTRPDVAAAEAERTRLDLAINPKPKSSAARRKK